MPFLPPNQQRQCTEGARAIHSSNNVERQFSELGPSAENRYAHELSLSTAVEKCSVNFHE